MSQNIVTLTDSNFSAEVNKATLPVMVDFWASWCGPCQMMAPVLEKIAEEFSGRLVVGKLNVDENQATARQFNVMSIPTLIFFKNGSEKTRITGFRPQEEINRLLNQALYEVEFEFRRGIGSVELDGCRKGETVCSRISIRVRTSTAGGEKNWL